MNYLIGQKLFTRVDKSPSSLESQIKCNNGTPIDVGHKMNYFQNFQVHFASVRENPISDKTATTCLASSNFHWESFDILCSMQ